MDDACAKTVKDVLEHFDVDLEVGLDENGVRQGIDKYGYNGVLQ